MWARDQGAALQNTNLYGVHPFYLQMVPPSTPGKPFSAHGFFMLNSNAMSVTILSDSLTWQLSGGVIDLWLFTGSHPASVVEQYTRVIGRPHLPPYWGLGWHQCRSFSFSFSFSFFFSKAFSKAFFKAFFPKRMTE